MSRQTLPFFNQSFRRFASGSAGFGIVAASLVAAIALTGCSTMPSWQESKIVPIEGEEAAGPISVRVDNVAGDVRVRTSRDITRPVVNVRPRATGDIGRSDPESLVTMSAHSSTSQGLVLQIVAVAEPGYENLVAADIDVWVPALVDIQVRTSAGRVQAVGATGAVDIEVGTSSTPGGSIDVRAADELVESVRLITTDGNIHLAMPPGSTGAIELTSLDGNAEVRAASSPVSRVTASKGRWSGIIAQGRNAIQATTNEGNVRVIVMPDPVSYMPSK
ncbi:MAG: hypothetical protein H6815_03795 [Phycisphaeraceae bacterium]|nr:hypothetical protein [Phycisphaerales bacterium]MCB9859552.1 hypothetical protein [Phycisphaeraceae bacterium]